MGDRFLTDFELMVLLAVLRNRDDAYGVSIAREIEATAGRSVTHAAVYLALDRMVQQGLATARLGEPTPERLVDDELRELPLELLGRAEEQAGLAVSDARAIGDGAGEDGDPVRGALEELQVRLPLVEPRRAEGQQRDVGRAQDLPVTVVRAERLELLAGGPQGVEEGAIVEDADVHEVADA